MAGFLNTVLRSSTHSILLRNPEPKDASALAAILSNPANIEDDPMCSDDGLTISQASSMIEGDRISAAQPIPTRINLVVVILPFIGSEEESEVIGLSGFGGINEIEKEGVIRRFADVGAMINPKYRGKGLAVESMRLSIEFAFEKMKVDGISCQMLEKNAAIVGLVEKKFGWRGFRHVGKFGKEVRFEIDDREWEETKKRLAK